MSERVVWTYFLSRDSMHGKLSDSVSLWHVKPTRVRHRYRVTWVGTDPFNPGHLGEFRPEEIDAWWRVHPETDLELIRIETHPSERDLEQARRGAR